MNRNEGKFVLISLNPSWDRNVIEIMVIVASSSSSLFLLLILLIFFTIKMQTYPVMLLWGWSFITREVGLAIFLILIYSGII